MHTKLSKASIAELQKATSSAYIVDKREELVFCNHAWDIFARENGSPELANGRSLGKNLFDVIPAVLASFYRTAFHRVRTHREVWTHRYDCSSPSIYRAFRMSVRPMADSGSLIVTNDVLMLRSHEPAENRYAEYVDAFGMIRMCANCRRTKRADGTEWDFVAAHLERVSFPVSHGLCPVCHSYYYRNQRANGSTS